MPTLVKVTAEDIAAGHRNHCYYCPLALAIRRATGQKIMVGTSSLCFGGRARNLPSEATAWITRYDDGEPVLPEAFVLDLPET